MAELLSNGLVTNVKWLLRSPMVARTSLDGMANTLSTSQSPKPSRRPTSGAHSLIMGWLGMRPYYACGKMVFALEAGEVRTFFVSQVRVGHLCLDSI